MHWFRNSRFSFDALRNATCKFGYNFWLHQSSSTMIRKNASVFKSNISEFTSPSTKLSFQFGIGEARHHLVQNRRYYYVDRNNVQHFKARGPSRWFQNPRIVFVAVAAGSGAFVTVYYGNLETIPYTKRSHFVLLSRNLERQIGEAQFDQMKAGFRDKILPAIHPDSIRVRMIAQELINALHKGLKEERRWSDPGSVVDNGYRQGRNTEDLLGMVKSAEKVKGTWSKGDEILDDKWVQESRKRGQERGSQPFTQHLQGLNWEVMVVDEPVINAFCLPGGKIVVFTGLLRNFRNDAEIATIIGHEVAHAVARHAAEGITKNLWYAILQLILYQFVMPDVVNTMSALFLRLPFSRRMEMEADYIGLLLVASAGYDPRIVPKVYEKLGKLTRTSAIQDYLSTHPSGQRRARLLAEAKVMEEAVGIYREVRAGRVIEGFL